VALGGSALVKILHNLFPKSWRGPDGSPPESLRRWLLLIAFVLLTVVFVQHIAPLSDRIPWISTQVKAIRDSAVETGAFWWSNVPEVGKAERHFRGLNLIHEKLGKSPNTATGKTNHIEKGNKLP
jgi:hypothetical protein